jgi:uncharacterized cupin superfamily protein
MNKPVINIEDIELRPRPAVMEPKGETAARFDARIGQIAPLIGARQLGYNITAVPPGKRAFPFHNHRVNEEMFFVLQGTGELRFGGETYPLRPGDVIACPAGGRDYAHQIVNSGAEQMRYLAISTKLSPEIAEYPDSNKFGVLAQFEEEAGGAPRMFYHIGREGEGLDYWEGE